MDAIKPQVIVIIKILLCTNQKEVFKTDKRQQHTLMKFLKNVCTFEEEDESVNNNVEPIITDTDTSSATTVIEVDCWNFY